MSRRGTDYSVSIVIWGFACDPSVITSTLQTKPSETWRVGNPVLPGATNVHKENGWKLRASYGRLPENLGEAIDVLMGQFSVAADRLSKLPSPHVRTIQCSVFSYNREAVLHIPNGVLTRMAAIGAELDIDYYELPGEAREGG